MLSLDFPFDGKSGKFISHEVYFLVHLPKNTTFSFENMEAGEKDTFHNLKWWNLEELRKTDQSIPGQSGDSKILIWHPTPRCRYRGI